MKCLPLPEKLASAMGGLIVVLDPSGNIQYLNNEVIRLTGYDPVSIKGNPFWTLFCLPQEVDVVRKTIIHTSALEVPQSMESFWRTSEGDLRRIVWSVSSFPKDEDQAAFLIASGVDITLHHDAEMALMRRFALKQAVTSQWPGTFFFCFDSNYKGLLAGGSGLAEAGLSLACFEGDNVFDRMPASFADRMKLPARNALRGMTFHHEMSWGGRVYDMQVIPMRGAQGEIWSGLACFHDITPHKELERHFLTSKERYQLLFDSNPHAMWIYDCENLRILGANSAAVKMYGYTVEEFLRLTVWDLSPGQNEEGAEPPVPLGETEEFLEKIREHRLKDSSVIQVRLNALQFTLPGRQARLVLAVDVTNQLKTESALRNSEQRFRALVQNSADVILQLDNEGVIKMASASVMHILKKSEKALEGVTLQSCIHEDDRQRLLDCLQELLAHPEKEVIFEGRWQVLPGEYITIEATGQNLQKEPAVQGLVVHIRNVTEKRNLEEQLRQSQKMESIGRLAGGIAHDFNNILTAIQGYSELALAAPTVDEELREYLQQVALAASRASSLTRQLLAFSRQQVIQLRAVDLNQVIADLSVMLMRLLGEGIDVRFDCAPEIGMIQGDKSMIEQVLLNLVVNARDAMGNGGVLTLKTAQVSTPLLPEIPGKTINAILMEVADTGCGMDQRTQDRIFEPFFTTKEIGKGTGLGLSTVYGIIKQHQGRVTVDSSIGTGTSFRVYLPPIQDVMSLAQENMVRGPLLGGTETLLIAEDEEPVRVMVVAVLRRQGYRVLESVNGIEALEVWRRNREKIDLVLTDIMMPGGMTGCDLAQEIRKEDAGTRIVFCSGYSPSLVAGEMKLNPGVNFIPKPFTPAELIKTVRCALDSPAQIL